MNEHESIPNYSFFDVSYVQIQIFHDEAQELYTSGLLLFLDDGVDEEPSDMNITIPISLEHTNPETLAKLVFIQASSLFGNISPSVLVWDEALENSTTIDLRQIKSVPDTITVH